MASRRMAAILLVVTLVAAVNTYSGAATITISSGTYTLVAPSTTPPGSLAGLVVQLDANDVAGTGTNPANGTQISTWVNKAAGGAGNFTANGAQYPYVNWTGNLMNGQTAVHFWGGLLQNTTNFGNNVTVMYVGRMDGGANQRLLSSTGNNWLLGYWGGHMDADYWNNGGNLSGPAPDYSSHIYAGTADGTTAWAYNIDTTEAQFDTRALGQGPNGLAIGGTAYTGGLSELSYADVGEVLVFNRALTAGERGQMAAYLQGKWFGPLPPATAIDITASGAALDLNGVNQTIGSLAGVDGSGVLLNGGWLTIGQDGTSTTFSGAITNGSTAGGGLSKLGGGTLTLAGSSPNTFTGPTQISRGYVALSKNANVTAIAGDIQMVNSVSPTLWTTADNQFGAAAGVLSFVSEVNTSPGNARFNLEGTTQTLAGIVETDAYRAGVIQNSESGYGGPNNTGTSTLVLSGSGNYSFNGYLRNANGTLQVSKTGTGTQTLVGDRINYTGATAVSGGTLVLQDTTGFASPVAVQPGGTLNAVRTALGLGGRSPIMGNAITGSGIININNSGSGIAGGWTTVSGGTGSLNFSGTINVNSGVFARDNTQVDTINGTATVNVAAGAVFGAGRGGNSTIGALNGAGDVSTLWGGASAGSLTLGNGGASGSFSGVIHGNGTNGADGTLEGGVLSLIKVGSGTQTLSGANTYTGATTVQAGQLILFNATTFNSPTTVNSGAKLSWSAAGNMGNGNTGATIALNNGGTLENLNPANWTVISGAITNTGTTTINQTSNTTTAAGEGFFLDGGLKGTGTVTINAANAGSGVNFRNNNSTFSGMLIVNGIASGTAFAGSGIGVGGCTTGLQNADITLNGTMEMLNQGIGWANGAPGDFWMGALNGTGVMVANFTGGGQTRVRIGNTNNNGTFSGVIADGTGDQVVLTKVGSGTQALNGSSAFTGTDANGVSVSINGGTLSTSNLQNSGIASGLGSSGSIGLRGGILQYTGAGGGTNRRLEFGTGTQTIDASGTGALTLNGSIGTDGVGGNRTLNLTGSSTGANTFTIAVADTSGTWSVTKNGLGTWVFNQANTYTGATTVNNGILQLTDIGNHVFNSPVTINAAGTLVVNSSISFLTRWNYNKTLSGTGTFIKQGTGVFGIDGVNNFAGQMYIQAGRLMNDNVTGNWTGATADVDISSGAVLDLRANDIYVDSLTGVAGAEIWNSHTAGGTRTLFVGVANGSGTFSGTIRGTGGTGNDTPNAAAINLVKRGTGVETLSGANTYTGATTINGGTLKLDFSAGGAPAGDILSSGSALALAGGTLAIQGNGSTTSSQTVNGLTLNAASSAIIVASGSGGTANLTLGAITRTGGFVDFTLPASGNITTTTGNTNGILGPWATVGGTDWAANDGTGNIMAYTGYTNIAALGSTIPDASAANVRINFMGSGGNIVLGAATTTINTLLQDTATAATVDTVGQTLRTGGIQINSGQQALKIGAAAGDGTLSAATPGGDLALINNSGNALTINAAIANNTSASSLTTSGTGTVTLSGANTYTGTTTVSGGVLEFVAGGSLTDSNTAIGHFSSYGGVKVSGGNLHLYRPNFNTGSLEITGGTFTTDWYPQFGNGAGTFTWTQNGGTTYINGSNAALNVAAGGSNSTLNFSGGTINANGFWSTAGFGGSPTSICTLNLSGAAVFTVNGGNGLYTGNGTSNFNLNGGTFAIPAYYFNFNGNSTAQAVNWNFNGGTLKALGAVSIAANAQTTTTILSGGAILDTNGSTINIESPLTGPGGLTKLGSGTLTLTGANTYSGGTTINAGTLALGRANTLNMGGAVTINAAGTFDLGGFNQQINGPITGTGTITNNGAADAQLIFGQDGADIVFNGVIQDGARKVLLFKGWSKSYTLGGNAPNTYTGTTGINNGSLILAKTAGNAIGGDLEIGQAGNYNSMFVTLSGKGEQIADTAVVTFTPGSSVYSYLKLMGFNETVAGINGTNGRGVIEVVEGDNVGTAGSTLILAGAGTYSYNGYIRDKWTGTSGALSLTKTGSGTQTLSGSNITFTGPTTVNGGVLVGAGPNAFGAASSERTITVNSGGTLNFAVNGLYGGHYQTNVPALVINAGGTVTNSGGPLNNPLNNVTLAGGTLTSTTANGLWGAWNINGTVTSTGNSLITTAAPANGHILLNSAGTNTNFDVQSGTLMVVVDLLDGRDSGSPYAVHTTSLTKLGSGTLTLTGSNTYSGGTTINAGTLLVSNTSGSGTGSGPVVVAGGATLGGTGTISAPVTALSGGHVAPGNNLGTLHTGNLDLQAGSFFDVEMTPTAWDMLDVTGTVDVSGAILNLSPLASFSGAGGGQYMIVQNDSNDAVSGLFAGLNEGASIEVGGAQFAISYVGGTDRNDIVLTSVPEPATMILLGLAATGLARYVRRRRQAV